MISHKQHLAAETRRSQQSFQAGAMMGCDGSGIHEADNGLYAVSAGLGLLHPISSMAPTAWIYAIAWECARKAVQRQAVARRLQVADPSWN